MSDTEQRFRLAMPKDLADKSIVILNKSGVNHAMGYDVRDMVTNSGRKIRSLPLLRPQQLRLLKKPFTAHTSRRQPTKPASPRALTIPFDRTHENTRG